MLLPMAQVMAHGVQIAYTQLSNGFLRVYIEHWLGDQNQNYLSGNGANISMTYGSTTVTQNLDATSFVNNTTLGNLPGNPTSIGACSGYANYYNDWVYYDFAPAVCGQAVTITVNYGLTAVLTEACSGLYPAAVTATFYDNSPPVLTCADVYVQSCGDSMAATYSVQANDACDPNPSVSYSIASGSTFAFGTTQVTATATDNTNSSSTCTFNVNVGDFNPPQALCQNATVYLDQYGSGSITTGDIDNGSNDCDTITLSLNQSAFSCSNTGQNSVTLTVTDPYSNSSTCNSVVTVLDTTQLVISCPGDTTVDADNGLCGALVSFEVDAHTSLCDILPSYSQGPNTTFPIGTTTVTASASTYGGSSGTCSFDITVEDNVAPVITCMGDTTLSLDNNSCEVQFSFSSNGSNNLYGFDYYGNSLYTYDSSYNYISSTSISYDNGSYYYYRPMGMAKDPTSGSVYVLVGPGGGTNRYLGTINLETAAITIIGNLNEYVSSIAFTSDGTLYGVIGNGGSNAYKLCTINTSSLAISYGISVASGGGQNIAYNTDDNHMYHWAGSSFEKINLSTNDITNISLSGNYYFYATRGATYIGNGEFLYGGYYGYYMYTVSTSGVGDWAGYGAYYQGALLFDGSSNGISASDNCSATITQISGLSSGSNFPAGTTTNVFVATDASGNSDTCSFNVTVLETVAPEALCKGATISLSNGSASISTSDIDDGSYNNCGTINLSLDNSAFDCDDIGTHTVTLTVTDNNNNESTCTSTVTVTGVVPTASIASSANTSGTVIGGTTTYAATNQMFIGYGAQSMNVVCTPNGGSSFTYSWTGDGLSSTTVANPVFTPTQEGNYTLTCTVTNNYGCEVTSSITICVINAKGNGGNANNPKVLICHRPSGNSNNTQNISVSVNAVTAHLGNHGGCTLGACGSSCSSLNSYKVGGEEAIEAHIYGESHLEVLVYPNPSRSEFNFILESPTDEMASLKVYDIQGHLLVETTNLVPNDEHRFGNELISGVYIVVVKQGDFEKATRVVKIN
jgi:hypothetical protein